MVRVENTILSFLSSVFECRVLVFDHFALLNFIATNVETKLGRFDRALLC